MNVLYKRGVISLSLNPLSRLIFSYIARFFQTKCGRPFFWLVSSEFLRSLMSAIRFFRRNGRNDDSGDNISSNSSSNSSSWVPARTNVEKTGVENGEEEAMDIHDARKRMFRTRKNWSCHLHDTGSRDEVKGRAPTGQ